jgi:hypothetical protein
MLGVASYVDELERDDDFDEIFSSCNSIRAMSQSKELKNQEGEQQLPI